MKRYTIRFTEHYRGTEETTRSWNDGNLFRTYKEAMSHAIKMAFVWLETDKSVTSYEIITLQEV